MQELLAGIRAGGEAYALCHLVKQVYEQNIGRIQKLRAINPLEQAVKKDKVRHKDKGLEL